MASKPFTVPALLVVPKSKLPMLASAVPSMVRTAVPVNFVKGVVDCAVKGRIDGDERREGPFVVSKHVIQGFGFIKLHQHCITYISYVFSDP